MKRKVLFTANTLRHLYLCHMPYLKYFSDCNYLVHTASNSDYRLENVDKSYKLSIKRSPYSFKNFKAFFQLRKIIKENNYDIIHTHTPMGAVVTRLAALGARRKGTKVIYTVHGFHFFKGASIFNWVLFYPIEKILSNFTDMIITINREDYLFAKKHFKTDVRYIDGVGFNEEKFKNKLTNNERNKFREKNSLNKDDYVISYVAELSKRKRQKYLLKTISLMDITNEKFLFIGDGPSIKQIMRLIKKYSLEDIVMVIDFNDQIANYLDISDLIISVSKQEGLPLNIMEAMYKKKPIIVSDCRGNRDLIQNHVNGIVVSLDDKEELIRSISYMKNNRDIALTFGNKGFNLVKKYSINVVIRKMEKIYGELMAGYKKDN